MIRCLMPSGIAISTCTRVVCMLTLLAAPAAAQSPTEDGIRAVLRGDYEAAARILKPLADDHARPDPIAQFFLAILYHTGQGVVRDEFRACGLFLRSAAREHPFSQQSAALADFAQQLLGDGAPRFCVQDERWQGGPPVSFQLGPGHRIVFADTNITVTYEEREQRMLQLLPAGAAFLPIRHAPLDVTRPIRARRDFFQLFLWVPDRAANPSSWTLAWWLGEVAGDMWAGLAGEENLAVVRGVAPPASYDVTHLVRLEVNASGEAQFTIVGGPSARTEVIPRVRIP
jgi:hypothetical protein